MLIASKLPAQYYAEAQLTAAYIHNRCAHGDDTIIPFEHIYKRKPNLAHLRPFGCVAYAHIPAEVRSKLESSAVKCRLLGYLDADDVIEHQGYKLLRESDLAIVFSRDVRFDEGDPLTPLNSSELYDDDTLGDDLFGDPTYSQDDSNNSHEDSHRTQSVSPLFERVTDSRLPHYHPSLITTDHVLEDINSRTTRSKNGG